MTYTEPLLLIILSLCIAGIFLSRGRSKSNLKLTAAGVICLLLAALHPAAWLFSRPLEAPFSQVSDSRGFDAIVVPGSDYLDPEPERPFAVADQDTYGRCRMAAWLYREVRHVPVLVSGHWATRVMRQILEAERVPSESIWEEGAARSTHENAVFSARILRSRKISRIAVVSEARSMLRVKWSFEKQGLAVSPWVWRRTPLLTDWRHLLPNPEAVACNEETLHETVGLAWYRLRGWI